MDFISFHLKIMYGHEYYLQKFILISFILSSSSLTKWANILSHCTGPKELYLQGKQCESGYHRAMELYRFCLLLNTCSLKGGKLSTVDKWEKGRKWITFFTIHYMKDTILGNFHILIAWNSLIFSIALRGKYCYNFTKRKRRWIAG